MTTESWAENEQTLQTALSDAQVGDWQQAFHVAIDRWTGGAAEGMLYTVLEPHGTKWERLELDVNLERIDAAEVSLLLLVLRDMKEGRLPLGFGVNRGMGAVKVMQVAITPDNAGEPYGAEPFGLSNIPMGLKAAWAVWVADNAVGVPLYGRGAGGEGVFPHSLLFLFPSGQRALGGEGAFPHPSQLTVTTLSPSCSRRPNYGEYQLRGKVAEVFKGATHEVRPNASRHHDHGANSLRGERRCG